MGFSGIRIRPHSTRALRVEHDPATSLFETYVAGLDHLFSDKYWLVCSRETTPLGLEVLHEIPNPQEWWAANTVDLDAGLPDYWALFRPAFVECWTRLVGDGNVEVLIGLGADGEIEEIRRRAHRVGWACEAYFAFCGLERPPSHLEKLQSLQDGLGDEADSILVTCDPGWELLAKDRSLIDRLRARALGLEGTEVDELDLGGSFLWELWH